MLEIDENINPCNGCQDYNPLDSKHGCRSNGGCGRKQTNADRIRSMTDEELAEWIFDRVKCQNCPMLPCVKHGEDGKGNCKELWLAWLREEANDEEIRP